MSVKSVSSAHPRRMCGETNCDKTQNTPLYTLMLGMRFRKEQTLEYELFFYKEQKRRAPI